MKMVYLSIKRRVQEVGPRNITLTISLLAFIYVSILCLTNTPRKIDSDTLIKILESSGASQYWKKYFLDNKIQDITQLASNLSTLDTSDGPEESTKIEGKKRKHLLPHQIAKHKRQKAKEKALKQQDTDEAESVTHPDDIDSPLPNRQNRRFKNNYGKDVVVKVDHWNQTMAEARERVFEKRGNHIRNSCQNMNWKKYSEPAMKFMEKNLRWATKYNLLWCPIFKAASTTWVKNFLLLAGEKKIASSLHGRVRMLYPKPEDLTVKTKMLKTAMKMIIVRHPLDRLLSAYRDKMLRVLRKNDPYHMIQIAISTKYKDPYKSPNKDIVSSHRDDQPSFNQFLLRVRDDMRQHTAKLNKFEQMNLHWRPYWTTCSPCQMNYDVIAKVETLDEDQEYIIHEAHLEGLAFNARTHASNFDKYNGTSEATKAYFSSVPKSLLKEIVELYKPDFDIFDYSAEEYLNLAVPNI